MSDPYNLQRFLDAQEGIYLTALTELRTGAKRSHWMWFVFPQLAGLGRSPTAQYYGLGSIDEVRCYLEHLVLGQRLREGGEAILPWAGRRSAEQIFGSIDALKLRSSLTLFDAVEPRDVFADALGSFYGGEPDERTLALLNGQA